MSRLGVPNYFKDFFWLISVYAYVIFRKQSDEKFYK